MRGVTRSLVICDRLGQCLWWLTTAKQGDDVKLGYPQHHKLEYNPLRVSSDRSGRAVVTDHDNHCVHVYSHPGKHVMSIQLSGVENLRNVLSDQSDGFVITHGFPFKFSWVNSAGQETHQYTGQPHGLPNYILDDGTKLLVSDRLNRCAHMVTRDGRHHSYLITDIDPTCVCLDPAGRRL